jgi:hypothetical protein
MTPEQRMLLEGDEKRAARNLPAMGFGDATGAPPRFAARIAEIRSAIRDGRTIPPPSAEYRASAKAFEQTLFPTRANQRTEQPTTTSVEKLRRSLNALSIF